VADNNGMGRVFARGKKGKKQTAPWTSYSSRVGGGGARGGPGAHGDWTAAAHQWCAAESAGLTVDRRFETKFKFQMDSN
jgi:hypothetical protein